MNSLDLLKYFVANTVFPHSWSNTSDSIISEARYSVPKYATKEAMGLFVGLMEFCQQSYRCPSLGVTTYASPM